MIISFVPWGATTRSSDITDANTAMSAILKDVLEETSLNKKYLLDDGQHNLENNIDVSNDDGSVVRMAMEQQELREETRTVTQQQFGETNPAHRGNANTGVVNAQGDAIRRNPQTSVNGQVRKPAPNGQVRRPMPNGQVQSASVNGTVLRPNRPVQNNAVSKSATPTSEQVLAKANALMQQVNDMTKTVGGTQGSSAVNKTTRIAKRQ